MDSMRFVSSRVHGVLDYLIGLALLLAPNLFGFADVGGAPVWIPRVLGIVILGQSLMTDYELGLLKVLPFQAHLAMDYLVGGFLALSPFLFGFYDNLPANAWVPHLVVGLVILVETLFTRPRAYGREAMRTS